METAYQRLMRFHAQSAIRIILATPSLNFGPEEVVRLAAKNNRIFFSESFGSLIQSGYVSPLVIKVLAQFISSNCKGLDQLYQSALHKIGQANIQRSACSSTAKKSEDQTINSDIANVSSMLLG